MTNDSSVDVLNLTLDELKEKFKKDGIEPYRAAQVHQWVFEKGVYDFKSMSNLPESLRADLKKKYSIFLPEISEEQKSSGDKSVKLLLKLQNNDFVEAVYMRVDNQRTVCISSQVGCKFHCAFCASGQDGFLRNLSVGEILGQILRARDLSEDKKITNVVFMGIGEPFDNYKNVLKAIRQLNAKSVLGLGARRITVSTCGVIPKMYEFSEEGMQIELSVSLHGPNDSVRGSIMPVNKAHPVKELIEACKKYTQKTKRVITFEYILIKGVNASNKEAEELGRLLKSLLCKVNLIPYNSIEEFPHEAPNYDEVVSFQKILQRHGVKTTVRFSKGQDIQAACGQLRSVQLKK